MEELLNEEHVNKQTDEIWKKWVKSKDTSRFFGVRPWLQGSKFSLDIGLVNGSKLTGHATAFVGMIEFVTTLEQLLANYDRNLNFKSNSSSFKIYGGGNVDGKLVSRVISIAPFFTEGSGDANSALQFRITHLAGQKTSTGAIMPKQPNEIIADYSIKVTAMELRQMLLCCKLYLFGSYVKNEEWSPF